LEAAVKITVYTFDQDVMRFRYDSMVNNVIFYLVIDFQMLNRHTAVKLLMVLPQTRPKFNKYYLHEYSLWIAKHQCTNNVYVLLFKLYLK